MTIKRALACLIEAFFEKIEYQLIKREQGLGYAPVFIIGPPRCGSTLLYQIMTKYFKVCYFSNLMMRLPKSPVTMAKFLACVHSQIQPSSFTNSYGETEGWRSPSQGVNFWDRWFPKDNSYVGPGVISIDSIKGIRNTIAWLQKIFDAPFVNKWQTNSVRLFPLSESLPEALFIRIKRDLPLVAQSILIGKRELFKDEMRWFSSKPQNYEQIRDKKPIAQVCEQVFFIEKGIDHDSKIIGEEKFFTVQYKDLCESPQRVLNEIKNFYDQHSTSHALVIRDDVPASFECSCSIQLTIEEFDAIEKYLSELQRYNSKYVKHKNF